MCLWHIGLAYLHPGWDIYAHIAINKCIAHTRTQRFRYRFRYRPISDNENISRTANDRVQEFEQNFSEKVKKFYSLIPAHSPFTLYTCAACHIQYQLTGWLWTRVWTRAGKIRLHPKSKWARPVKSHDTMTITNIQTCLPVLSPCVYGTVCIIKTSIQHRIV